MTQTHQRIIATGGIAAPQLTHEATHAVIPATHAECVAQRFTGVRTKISTGSCFRRMVPHTMYEAWGDGYYFNNHNTYESALAFLQHWGYIATPVEQFPDNLPLEPMETEPELFRPAPATTRDKRVQSKAELRCYAVARNHDLNPHSAASMRDAFNSYYGTSYASRTEFSEDEWKQFTRDIEDGTWVLGWKQVLFKKQVAA